MVDHYAVEKAILRLIQDEHGTDAVTRRPSIFFDDTGYDLPGPTRYLQGMRTALETARAAENLARDWARNGRAAGASWDDVAKALGQYLPESEEPGHEAFTWVAPSRSQRFDELVTTWRCESCKTMVTDRGPWAGHPDEEEVGHGEGCARHADDLMAWKKRQGYDDDEL